MAEIVLGGAISRPKSTPGGSKHSKGLQNPDQLGSSSLRLLTAGHSVTNYHAVHDTHLPEGEEIAGQGRVAQPPAVSGECWFQVSGRLLTFQEDTPYAGGSLSIVVQV